jgi:gamma-glutamylcyclotransferase (GGCT)/AIG2-like uncharacterized protein YtfP
MLRLPNRQAEYFYGRDWTDDSTLSRTDLPVGQIRCKRGVDTVLSRAKTEVAAAMPDERTILLFSYGTLQQDEVQLASFGRLLDGQADAMIGYRQAMLEITDPDIIRLSGRRFHPVVEASENPDDVVNGKVFRITEAELKAADEYEVSDYKRILVPLRSGNTAWVYVRA